MESEDQSAPAELVSDSSSHLIILFSQPIPLQACSRGLPLVRFSPRQSIAVFIAPNPDGSEDGAGSSEYDDEERTEEGTSAGICWLGNVATTVDVVTVWNMPSVMKASVTRGPLQ